MSQLHSDSNCKHSLNFMCHTHKRNALRCPKYGLSNRPIVMTVNCHVPAVNSCKPAQGMVRKMAQDVKVM